MGEKIFQVCLSKVNDTGEALYTELDLPARPWALLDALDKVRYREGNDLSLEIDTYYDCEELEPHLSADQLDGIERPGGTALRDVGYPADRLSRSAAHG